MEKRLFMNKRIFFLLLFLLLLINTFIFVQTEKKEKEYTSVLSKKRELMKLAKEYTFLKEKYRCKEEKVTHTELKKALNDHLLIEKIIITKEGAEIRCKR